MSNNKEKDKCFYAMENRLDAMLVADPTLTFHPSAARSDEIDLRDLWNTLWKGKWWIIGVTSLFAVAGAVYALSLPSIYKSEGIYASAQRGGSGAGVTGQLGGLASFAGVSLGGGESNDIDQAVVLMTSWPFLEQVINKHDLKPLIMGVNGWNRETGKLSWDQDIYDPASEQWLRDPPSGREAEPSSYETYIAMRAMIGVDFDAETSMLNISIRYYSPVVAQEWVRILADEINETFRTRDIVESKRSIDYLEQKIAETSIAEMQAVFYGMIESQMKTLMLAEVDDEYLFRQVVEPKISEVAVSPNRMAIVMLSVFIGGVAVVLVIFVRSIRV